MRRFKIWGFDKNVQGDAWKTVHQKIDKRKNLGKETVIYHYGKLVSLAKLAKEKRHAFFSIGEKYGDGNVLAIDYAAGPL